MIDGKGIEYPHVTGFGVAGLLLSRTWEGSRNFLIGGGMIYLALWLPAHAPG